MFSGLYRIGSNQLRRIDYIRHQSTSEQIKSTSRLITKANDGKSNNQLTNTESNKVKRIYGRPPKKPARPPLVKRFFAGEFDSELMAYPEVVTRENMANVQEAIGRTNEYFRVSVDSKRINESELIPSSVVDGLRYLDAFGIDVPHTLGGGDYSVTESCLRNESEAVDVNVAKVLNVHRLVTQILNEYGSDMQKSKFLPLLAKGDIFSSLAIIESEVSPNGFFNTKATATVKGEKWSLNGKKTFVINARNADLLLVIAESNSDEKLDGEMNPMTAFLIETDMPGVEIKDSYRTISSNEIVESDIIFNDVQLGSEHVIGTFDKGSAVAHKLLIASRLQAGILCTVVMRQIIKEITNYCLNTTQSGVKLSEMDIFKNILSKAVRDTYALESMIYLTTGIIDEYENADVDLETAIIKVFGHQSLLRLALQPLNFMGPEVFVNGKHLTNCLKSAIDLYTRGETIDSAIQYIGLSGLQYTGKVNGQRIKMIRNPFFYPAFSFKRFFEYSNLDRLKKTLNIHYFVHESLEPSSDSLEFSIIRLKIGTELLLCRFGAQVLDKQNEIHRLAECAILTYAMFATLSRASRSYCIGLRYCDYETVIASIFCQNAEKEVRRLIEEIGEGPIYNDMNDVKISKQVFKEKGYYPIHPLIRNF